VFACLPLVFLCQYLFILFASLLCAALVPFFPDLRNLIGHGLHLMFFISGVFFEVDSLPKQIRTLVYINPMAGILASARQVMLHHQLPDFTYLFGAAVCSLLGIATLLYILDRYDSSYAKTG
jgi:lipopolysaccharide transport system permease protein